MQHASRVVVICHLSFHQKFARSKLRASIQQKREKKKKKAVANGNSESGFTSAMVP